jgi:hypothetical protein
MTPVEFGVETGGIGKVSSLPSIHIESVKIQVRMHPTLQFKGTLVLESE